MTDRDLLDSISCKDESAFRQFYRKYYRLLYSWATRRTGDLELTDECVQEFWIYIWTNPQKIKTDDQGNCKNFLLHHFTWSMLNYINRQFYELDKSITRPVEEVQDELPYSHVEEELNMQELGDIISRLILELPESIREAFRLYWQENYSVMEIAAELKITERTAAYKVKSGFGIVKKSIPPIFKKAIRNISFLSLFLPF